MNFSDVKEMNNSAQMPTYARFDLALKEGKGARATDFEGKNYIDFTSGIGVNSLGWCDEGWTEAITKQAITLSHTSNLYYNSATASLSAELTKLTGFSKVFLCNSGAEANECALKLARKYSFDKYGEGRNEIITFENSFHGRTMATLTLTAQDSLHPGCFAPYNGGIVSCRADKDSFKEALSDKTCAVMFEIIQGEGGVIPIDRDLAEFVFTLAHEKDILVIIDEVQTGMARTGRLCAFENYGLAPDIVTLAKGLGGGLPIGACLCTEDLAQTMTAGTHGSTFGGNPIVCAGAKYVLSRIAEPCFLENIRETGEYMRQMIMGFKNVRSVRGMGMMIGIEVEGKKGADIAKACIENGLMVLTAKSLVRLLPPLNITRQEVDEGLEILKRVIEE